MKSPAVSAEPENGSDFQHYDLKPDIVAVGKGIGNGYPVSAVMIGENVIKEAEISDFHFAQSHQNDPMGCRVACEVIKKN